MADQHAPRDLPGFPDLVAIARAFAAARGVPGDADWARTAAARFVLDDVREDLAHAALVDLLPQIAETGESPEELFGESAEWARERVAVWREEGVAVTEPRRPATARQLVLASLTGAAYISVLIFVFTLVSGSLVQAFGIPLAVTPLLLGAAGQAFRAVYDRVLLARSHRAAVASAATALVLMAGAIAGFLLATADQVTAEVSAFWLLAVATGYGAAAALVGRMWPEGRGPAPLAVGADPVGTPQDDEAWFDELAAALRGRGDMTDAHVRRMIAETRDHAADAARPLIQEFGPPAAYAARFPARETASARRSAWLWSALSMVPAGLLVSYVVEDGWRWGSPHLSAIVWLAACLVLAGMSWRTALSPRSGTGA